MDKQVLLEIVQKIILVLLQLFVPLALAWLATKVRSWIEEKQVESWFKTLESIVAQAVAAAEQLGLTEQLADFADTKLDYAIQYIEQQLALRGIPIDIDPFMDAIRGMIEAEVQRQFPRLPIVDLEIIE